MNYNSKKKKKTNKIVIGIIIAFAIVISIYLLSVVNIPIFSKLSRSVLTGIDNVFSSISGLITNGSKYFGNTKKLNEKIEELETIINEKEMELVEKNVLEVENADLRKMLNINEKYNHFEKIYANVITRSYDNWNETFVINKGTKDGIKEKQTVISEDGLVGYVSKAYEDISEVVTILDATSAVSVEISNINALALVKGDNSLKSYGKVKLVNIPIDTELTIGETVYSSGIGKLYKKGIPIGNIIEVVNKKNDIDRYAIVKIFVDIESLDMVAIIK